MDCYPLSEFLSVVAPVNFKVTATTLYARQEGSAYSPTDQYSERI